MPDNKRQLIDEPISRTEAARLLGCTVRWFSTLVKNGYIQPTEDGAYMPAVVVQGALRAAQEDKRNTEASAAHTRLASAKAKIAELRLEQEKARLAPVEALDAYVRSVAGNLLSRLGTLPPRYTRDRGERRRLGDLIDVIKNEFVAWLGKERAELDKDIRAKVVGRTK